MTTHLYFAYVIIAFFTIVSPGAAVLLAITNGLNLDTKAVLLSTLGNTLGLFILSSISMLGVGAILQTSTVFFTILKFIGAGYLIYLGFKQIKNSKSNTMMQASRQTVATYNKFRVFKRGFLLAITNPKPILFFTAIFPLFMDKHSSVIPQFFLMTLTFLGISFVSLMFYGWMSSNAKSWFDNPKRIEIFYKFSGALFVMMGVGMMFLEQNTKNPQTKPALP